MLKNEELGPVASETLSVPWRRHQSGGPIGQRARPDDRGEGAERKGHQPDDGAEQPDSGKESGRAGVVVVEGSGQ